MFWSVVGSIALFVGLLAGLWAGRMLGRRAKVSGEESSAADNVVFAVLGLLLAFTFTAAASRFDERRKLIVQHANALGTAQLRLDVVDPAERAAIRAKMAQWVDLSLNVARSHGQADKRAELIAQVQKLENEIWQMALAAVERRKEPPLIPFVMSPLNEWIDLTGTRLSMEYMGPPRLVMETLVALALLAAVTAGFGTARCNGRRPLQFFAFAGVIAFAFYVIIDLNHPRLGLINIDAVDRPMIELGKALKQAGK